MNDDPAHSRLLERIHELEKRLAEHGPTQTALLESQTRYRAVVEDIPALICRFLPDGTLNFVNSAFCAFFGKYRQDLLGQCFFDLLPPAAQEDTRSRLAHLRREAPTAIAEYESPGPEGPASWLEWTFRALFDENGQLSEIQSVGRDITTQKRALDEMTRAERRSRQMQKIEALATLAGGIAHDFNNILSAVIGYSELSLLYLPKKSPTRDNVKKIIEVAQRARDLVKLIQLVGLDEEFEQYPVPIQPAVAETLRLIRSSLPESIELREHLACESKTVLCEPAQIHRIVANLCTNACHSMREAGGVLSVGLDFLPVEDCERGPYDELKPGPCVRLTVGDTGGGMTDTVLERIFDPYFTTKEHDIGTGLGLAVVRGIVQKCGGAIRVSSTPGQGTRFTVLLPAVLTTSL